MSTYLITESGKNYLVTHVLLFNDAIHNQYALPAFAKEKCALPAITPCQGTTTPREHCIYVTNSPSVLFTSHIRFSQIQAW